jgi:hypothetical protein
MDFVRHADKLRESLGEASANRFLANVWDHLDRDRNGSFDFKEFCIAFAPVIDDNGDYIPAVGLYGAQVGQSTFIIICGGGELHTVVASEPSCCTSSRRWHDSPVLSECPCATLIILWYLLKVDLCFVDRH